MSYFSRLLIDWVTSDDPYTWKGVFLAFVMLINTVISVLLFHWYANNCQVAGMRARTVLNAVVYQKVRLHEHIYIRSSDNCLNKSFIHVLL